jgi:hypothetical protein
VSEAAFMLMSTAETLGFTHNELVTFRLALIGWLVPSNDYSLLEVVMGMIIFIY